MKISKTAYYDETKTDNYVTDVCVVLWLGSDLIIARPKSAYYDEINAQEYCIVDNNNNNNNNIVHNNIRCTSRR